MSIPILGQPKVLDWSMSLVIECVCKNTILFQGRPESIVVTCKCGKRFMLKGLPQATPQGIMWPVAMAVSNGA